METKKKDYSSVISWRIIIFIFVILPLLSITLIMTSCSCSNSYKNNNNIIVNKYLGGNHELRKFNVKTTQSTENSGWFLLIGGGYSSRTISETTVRFYFLNYGNEYQLMEIPLNQVTIKIDNKIQIPYVIFKWINPIYVINDWRDCYQYVYSIIVFCKNTDFQPEININDLK